MLCVGHCVSVVWNVTFLCASQFRCQYERDIVVFSSFSPSLHYRLSVPVQTRLSVCLVVFVSVVETAVFLCGGLSL